MGYKHRWGLNPLIKTDPIENVIAAVNEKKAEEENDIQMQPSSTGSATGDAFAGLGQAITGGAKMVRAFKAYGEENQGRGGIIRPSGGSPNPSSNSPFNSPGSSSTYGGKVAPNSPFRRK